MKPDINRVRPAAIAAMTASFNVICTRPPVALFPPMDYRDELPLRLHQPFLD
jgi:hypothetical protein